ncbi:MAG: YidC/Oxa1 family membrane protein insertase [Clostridiales bacterium]|nr:YidC/Oxa1 family membrane protein insertase [Clostridiales bacterium]
MGLLNLLISIPSIGNFGGVTVKHEWIVNIIKWIIDFAGDVGLGIILFTLILKLITLPLDIYSRASMKKNELKMKLMKDDLEKLQKQYRNNSQLYQQKMMALYKKNGYSPMSACLPTIVTLIFFIVVISAFNSYSRFADKEVFNKMGEAYDQSLYEFVDDGILVENKANKQFDVVIYQVLENFDENKNYSAYFTYNKTQSGTLESQYSFNFDTFVSDNRLVTDYPNLANYIKDGGLNEQNADLTKIIQEDASDYIVRKLSAENISALKASGVIKEEKSGKYSISNAKVLATGEYGVKDYFVGEKYSIKYDKILEESSEILAIFETEGKKLLGETAIKTICNDYIEKKIRPITRESAKIAYEENANKSVIFPWVKNLWVVDSPTKSALPSIEELKTSIGVENLGNLQDPEVYKELTYNLGEYKNKGFGKGNGLFILVALSILTMLGSTIINNKAQKTQMQLSTVDGENSQAAMTQKMMTWMMPIMFGVFAFIYSAAFSIYMITSTLLSTGFTLLINFCVERAFKNKIAKIEEQKQNQRKYGKRRD